MWLGDAYLQDPVAVTLRDIICGRTEFGASGLQGSSDFTRPSTLTPWPVNAETHIAYFMKRDHGITVVLKILETFFMSVEVTSTAERYCITGIDSLELRFIEVNVANKTERSSSLSDEIVRLSK